MGKLRVILHALRGKPIIYNVDIHYGDGWTAISEVDNPKAMINLRENGGLLVDSTDFFGDGTTVGFEVKGGSDLHRQAKQQTFTKSAQSTQTKNTQAKEEPTT